MGVFEQRRWQGHISRQRTFDRIAQQHPATFSTGYRAFNHYKTALNIGFDHGEVLRGYTHITHVTGHFLALENLTRILTLPGRAVAPVRDRHTVRGAQTAKIMPLHGTGKTLTDGNARSINMLAFHEVIGGELGADINHVFRRHAKLGQTALRLNLGARKMPARGFGGAFDLGKTGTQLNGSVAVLVFGALGHNLTAVKLQYRHRHMLAGLGKQAGHPHFLNNQSGTHVHVSQILTA